MNPCEENKGVCIYFFLLEPVFEIIKHETIRY